MDIRPPREVPGGTPAPERAFAIVAPLSITPCAGCADFFDAAQHHLRASSAEIGAVFQKLAREKSGTGTYRTPKRCAQNVARGLLEIWRHLGLAAAGRRRRHSGRVLHPEQDRDPALIARCGMYSATLVGLNFLRSERVRAGERFAD